MVDFRQMLAQKFNPDREVSGSISAIYVRFKLRYLLNSNSVLFSGRVRISSGFFVE